MGTPTTARVQARSAVPLPSGEALVRVRFCLFIRKGEGDSLTVLFVHTARLSKISLPAGEGDRGVSLRTGGGGGSHFTALSPKRIADATH